jgi:hypothetical protein
LPCSLSNRFPTSRGGVRPSQERSRSEPFEMQSVYRRALTRETGIGSTVSQRRKFSEILTHVLLKANEFILRRLRCSDGKWGTLVNEFFLQRRYFCLYGGDSVCHARQIHSSPRRCRQLNPNRSKPGCAPLSLTDRRISAEII